MKIRIVARTTNLASGGVGRVPLELAKELGKENEVSVLECKGESLSSYMFYSSLRLPFMLGRADVYHAISPIESLWLPRNRSVVTFLDLMMVKDWWRTDAGMKLKQAKAFGVGVFSFDAAWAATFPKIACISEQTKQDVIDIFKVPEKKVRVIRLGINENLGPLGRVRSRLTFGYLGQIDKRKRVDLLIDSFEASNIDASLSIGGTGPLLHGLRGMRLDGRILFWNYVPEDILNEFYNRLDVFIFPSAVEGYGLPIVEAMACKKPVVVLKDAIIPKELKDRCIVVDDLKEVFISKYINEALTKMVDIEDNYRFAKLHSWKKCAQEYLKLYKEVTDGR